MERKNKEPGPLCSVTVSAVPLCSTFGNKILKIYSRALNLNHLNPKLASLNLSVGCHYTRYFFGLIFLVSETFPAFFEDYEFMQ